ncbi:MAG TPA: PAS domain-containing protein [Croceibacterium sp.]
MRAVTGAGAQAGVLDSYGIDALEDDPELTAIAGFAARLCGTPAAIVNLVESERQRFLGRAGLTLLGAEAGPASCCVHTMHGGAPMEVADASLDARFADNPFVTGPPFLRFYAGYPLISPEGVPLGALCVIDPEPRPEGLTKLQREGLAVLAQSVLRRLRARRDELATAEELERRELHLRALADSIPAIAWSADGEGNFDYFNRQLLAFTGNNSHEDGGAIHPDDFKRANALWQECLRTGETYETEHRVRRHDGEYRWMMARTVPFMGPDGRPVRWFGTAVDVHDAHELSESRDLLAKELSHRIKNIFAVVAGLVSLAMRRKPEAKEFGTELIGTIRALGRAHDYVRPAGGERRHSLHGMLEDLFLPYGRGESARVIVHGDDAPIADRSATPLALVFHELATNSAKYGALAAEHGTIDLTIADRGQTLLLRWVEHGGTMPEGEPAKGFGSHLIETSVTGQLGGSWERRFEPDGMVCDLTVSKAAIAP